MAHVWRRPNAIYINRILSKKTKKAGKFEKRYCPLLLLFIIIFYLMWMGTPETLKNPFLFGILTGLVECRKLRNNFIMQITTTPEELITLESIQLSLTFSKLKQKAQMRAIEGKLTQYYNKLIDEGITDDFMQETENVMIDVMRLRSKCNEVYDVKQGKSTHCFYTVNFKPEMKCMAEADKIVKTYLDKCKLITDYSYTIEQRSEEGEAEGIHAHILFDKNEAPSKYKTAFTKFFFDKYVGTHACLDFRYINPEQAPQKMEYIMGIKSKEKMPKVHNDYKIKKGLNINQYTYTEGHAPLIRQIEREQQEKNASS